MNVKLWIMKYHLNLFVMKIFIGIANSEPIFTVSLNNENEGYPGIPMEFAHAVLETDEYLVLESYFDSKHGINSPRNDFYSGFTKFQDTNSV